VGVDVGVEPRWRSRSGEGFAEGGPFGGILKHAGGGGEFGKPSGKGFWFELGEMALDVAELGQAAGLRVRIKTVRSQVKMGMGALVDNGFEPVAPALNNADLPGMDLT
jgi:hypothetical protein